MKTLIPYKKRLAGFTLVEMAIVLLISGILMSAGLALFMGKMAAAQIEVTQKRQEAIKQALINYLGQNKRLPCPGDSSGAEIRSATATPPPCVSYSGIVPYQTLGLDRSVALDGWENFIAYVVSPNLSATPLTQQIYPTPILTTAWLYTFSTADDTSHTTARNPTNPWLTLPIPNPPSPWSIPANSAFWPSTSTGGITVTDGTNPIANPATATGAAVVLISYGKNGYGAYNIKGKNSASGAGSDESKNINPTSGVPATVKRDITNSTAGGGAFDDIVMILSANDLIGPLVANGTLQSSSAQAALSQANDIVMGNIVANKLSQNCPAPPTYPANCAQPGITTYVSYTLPPTCSQTTTPPCSFPASVSAWGVSYTQFASPIYVTTPPGTAAYTITAGDGTTKTVLIGELQGILTRGAGF